MANRTVFGADFNLDVGSVVSGVASLKKNIKEIQKETDALNSSITKPEQATERFGNILSGLKEKIKTYSTGVEELKARQEALAQAGEEGSQEYKRNAKYLLELQTALGKCEAEQRKFTLARDEEVRKTKASQTETAKLTQEMKNQEKALASLNQKYQNAYLAGDTAKMESLGRSIKRYNEQLETNKAKLKEASQATSRLTQAQAPAKSAFEKLTDEINEQKSKLKELQDKYKSAVLSNAKDDAKRYKEEMQALTRQISENERQVSDLNRETERLGSTWSEVSQSMSDKAGRWAKHFITVTAGVVTGLVGIASATREFRTNMGKVDVAFKDAGLSAEDAKETYRTFYGFLADEGKATEATSLLGELAHSQKDLQKWTDISRGVFAKFGDSLPVEGLIEASNETAKTGAVVGGLADALNWAGISEEKFQKKLDSLGTEQERSAYIQKTLTKVYGDASTQYKETNKDIIASNEAQADLSTTIADVGKAFEPFVTKLKEFSAELVTKLMPAIEWMSKHMTLVLTVVGSFITLLGVATITMMAHRLQVALTVASHLLFGTTLANGTVQLGLFSLASKACTGAMALMSKGVALVTTGFRALTATMLANPIGLIIVAVTALVAIFVVLWKKCEGFRNFWKKLWVDIKSATDSVIKWLKKNWSSLIVFLINPIAGLFKYFYENFEGFRKFVDKILNSVKNIFVSAWNGIKKAWSGIGTWFSEKATAVVTAFKNLPSKMLSIGKDMIEGLKTGIKKALVGLKDKIKGWGNEIVGKFKSVFKINSPSKVMRDVVGKGLVEGIVVGIEKETKSLFGTVNSLSKSLLVQFKKANGNYTTAGQQVIRQYANGINSKAQDSIKAVKSLIDKQADSMKGYSKSAQADFKKAGQATLTAYTEAVKSGTDKAIASVSSSITKITDKVQAKYDEVISKQTAMKERLSGKELFTIDAETGKVTLNNLKDETAQIKKLSGNLLSLKKKLPKGLMEELAGLDTEQGLAVTDKIKSLSKKELNAYIASYKAREKASKNASEQYYKSEVNTIKSNFNTKISNALKTLPSKLNNIGVNTMSGFIKGMKSQNKQMSKTVKAISNDIVAQFKKDLKIHSPSILFEDEVGYNIPLGIAEGIKKGNPAIVKSALNSVNTVMKSFKKFPDVSEEVYTSLKDKSKVKGNFNEFKSVFSKWEAEQKQAIAEAKSSNWFDELKVDAKKIKTPFTILKERLEEDKKEAEEIANKLKSAYMRNDEQRILEYTHEYVAVQEQIRATTLQLEELENKVQSLVFDPKPVKTGFEKLNDTIKEQEDSLASLATEYGNAYIAGDTDAMSNIAEKIKVVNAELVNNKNTVKAVEDAVKALTTTTEQLSAYDQLLASIKSQEEALKILENQWISSAMAKGKDAEETQNIGKQIETLTASLKNNLEQAEAFQNLYKKIFGTVENISGFEKLSNTIKEQEDELKKLQDRYGTAYLAGDTKAMSKVAEEIKKVNAELTLNKQKLTDVENGYKALTSTIETEQLSAYTQLLNNIESEEEALKLLDDQYNSAVLTYGIASKEAKAFGLEIELITARLNANKDKVKELQAELDKLHGNGEEEEEVADTRNGFEKKLDSISDYFKKWQEGTGKYISQIEGYFSKAMGYITGLGDAIGDYMNQIWQNRIDEIDAQLEALEDSYDERTTKAKENYDAENAMLDSMYDHMTISAEEYYAKKKALEEDYTATSEAEAENQKQIEKQLQEEKNALGKKQFEADKRNQKAQVLINTASAIMKAFAEMGWVAGAIASAMLTATSIAQIASINAQKYTPALAKGGVVDGATLAMIGENGKEAVIPLEKNTSWMEKLAEQLNAVMKKDLMSNLTSQGAYATSSSVSNNVNNNFTQVINAPKTPSRRELYRDSKNLLALKGV